MMTSEQFDSLFGVVTTDAKPDKLPTFAQFIKSNKQPRNKPTYPIQLVWLPGKFDNFTLQTNAFRVICTPKHALYPHLSKFFGDSQSAEIGMSITITDWESSEYLLERSKAKGMWQEIGSSGYRWVNDI